MSIGSLEPPPVKIVEFGFGSAAHATAFAPVVFEDVEQSVPVTSWHTLSHSQDVDEVALPTSSNAPVSWTASTPLGIRSATRSAATTGATTKRLVRSRSSGQKVPLMGLPHFNLCFLPECGGQPARDCACLLTSSAERRIPTRIRRRHLSLASRTA